MNITVLTVIDPGDIEEGIRPYESRTYHVDEFKAEAFRAAAESAGFKATTKLVDSRAADRARVRVNQEGS